MVSKIKIFQVEKRGAQVNKGAASYNIHIFASDVFKFVIATIQKAGGHYLGA